MKSKFKKAAIKSEESEYCVERWESQNGVWNVRLDRVIYGCRVHVAHEDCAKSYHTDICCGSDPDWQAAVMYAVIKYLELFPEEVDPAKIMRDYPTAPQPKPLYRALEAWNRICHLAKLKTKDAMEVSTLADKELGIRF